MTNQNNNNDKANQNQAGKDQNQQKPGQQKTQQQGQHAHQVHAGDKAPDADAKPDTANKSDMKKGEHQNDKR